MGYVFGIEPGHILSSESAWLGPSFAVSLVIQTASVCRFVGRSVTQPGAVRMGYVFGTEPGRRRSITSLAGCFFRCLSQIASVCRFLGRSMDSARRSSDALCLRHRARTFLVPQMP
jgi:hypothetical protein